VTRPADLFDLAGCSHAALFDGVDAAWEALGARLVDYIGDTIRPGVRGQVHSGAYLIGDDIEIAEGAVVEPGAYIAGPAIIGPGTQVRHGAYIRGNVLVGAGCVVGHATEAKSSVFLDGAKAGHFAYVGDSILGRGANLGAGTKLANFKLTADEVVLRDGDRRIPTGMRKLGAICGDGCQTGCNSVTSPGTILGRGTFVYPCVSVRAAIYPARSRLT
jgi:NDP-sugar pyrophosphorylase family protein